MKKFVLKLDLEDAKAKQKAMKIVSSVSGIDSIAMDMNAKQLTVIGAVDPINVVSKLRKYWPTDIISVGPAKEPEEKKEEPKKEEEGKKEEEPKKDEGEAKKEEQPKQEDGKKDEKKEGEKKEEAPATAAPPLPQADHVLELVKAYNPHLTTYYYVQSAEENPNACVIC